MTSRLETEISVTFFYRAASVAHKCHLHLDLRYAFNVKKEKKIFLEYQEIQKGSGSKSYMRKGFLIYEEMRKYLVIYGEAVCHICLCSRSLLNFLIYQENSLFFFNSVAFFPVSPNFRSGEMFSRLPGKVANAIFLN